MGFWKTILSKTSLGARRIHQAVPVKAPPDSPVNDSATLGGTFSSFLADMDAEIDLDINLTENSITAPTFILPTYKTAEEEDCLISNNSPNSPLMFLDVVKALRKDYLRARLLLYEIARTASSLALILPRRKFKLEPAPLKLDRTLAAMLDESAFYDYFDSYSRVLHGVELKQFMTMIKADPNVVIMLATAKSTFLRLDKQFRIKVVDPLKRRMINGKDVNFEALEVTARSIHDEAGSCRSALERKLDQRESQLYAAFKREHNLRTSSSSE